MFFIDWLTETSFIYASLPDYKYGICRKNINFTNFFFAGLEEYVNYWMCISALKLHKKYIITTIIKQCMNTDSEVI